MKNKILVMLMSFCYLAAIAEQNPTHLVVWTKDGINATYILTEKPLLSFTDSELLIKTNEIEISYPIENMERITYQNNGSSSLYSISSEKKNFKFDGDNIVITPSGENIYIAVYSTKGNLVFAKNILPNEEYTLSLSQLSPSVYIVKVNDTTSKIIIK